MISRPVLFQLFKEWKFSTIHKLTAKQFIYLYSLCVASNLAISINGTAASENDTTDNVKVIASSSILFTPESKSKQKQSEINFFNFNLQNLPALITVHMIPLIPRDETRGGIILMC